MIVKRMEDRFRFKYNQVGAAAPFVLGIGTSGELVLYNASSGVVEYTASGATFIIASVDVGNYIAVIRTPVSNNLRDLDFSAIASGEGSNDINFFRVPILLETLDFVGDSLWAGNIEDLRIPDSLNSLAIQSTGIVGQLDLLNFQSIDTLSVLNSGCSLNLANLTLPATLTDFTYNNTLATAQSASGDVSTVTLPANMEQFYLEGFATGVTGDVSTLNLVPQFRLSFSDTVGISYGVGGLLTGVTASILLLDFTNCSLSEAEVNQILADVTASGVSATCTIELTGNTIPGAQGLTDKTTLEGRGFTVNVDV